ncbi:increased DNA methylation 1-like [Abrus precatorius]|uniref:Increased DNA methylation 1-like n=1 Tax=Abrus precatorius TaxID=3816 RepID=A0A8B8M5L1_ABRPR|nr:increased DNA methylation 1-like [Abrus precatorius]
MEPGTRIGGPSGVVVKNKSSSGCLIVRKKGDGLGGGVVGSSSTRRQFESKKVRKKRKVDLSDSGSSDELLMPPARRLGPETIRVCNNLTAFERGMVGGGEISRKRERMEQIRRNGDGMGEENGLERRERKRNKLDVFDFDEYDGMDVEVMRRRHFDNNGVGLGGGRFLGVMHAARSSIDREFETGSSRHTVDKRKNSYYDRASGLYLGDSVDHSRFKINRDGAQRPLPMLRERFNSDESIRVQGKNGVLKVMVNKKKVGGQLEHYDHHKPVESRQSLRAEGSAKRNVLIHLPSYTETKPVEKQALQVRSEKKQIAKRKSLSSKDSRGDEQDSDNSDTSLNLGVKNIEARKSSKKITSEDEQTPVQEKLPNTRMKEGKIKRGSGTEKQKLRERIREMLLNAGWTIDYRPRRNRDYLDAVYINPGGTAYWSIIKAYDALQKQLNDDDNEAKPKGESSSFAPISDDVLSQLTRKTRKKMEKDLKKKQRDDSESDSEKEQKIKRTTSKRHDMNGIDSDSNEEKLSSFIKQGSKSMKAKMIENAVTSGISKSQNATRHLNDGTEKSLPGNDSHLHGRKSRKHGRCTLLVRSSNKGLNSESDDFVPYTGKRTVLSWLVDSGVVQVGQKVQYRRRKRVMLEGWITRDGIHCGCCSKILTVSKFELHAGSKLPQPYQNIYLDSGVSLLQCQIDAWDKQENSKKISFHSVDIDGNDPNDDTCGICGDGGDLICCDGCPSTFHQNCLDIQMLPPGEWHCPNCTCKFCGLACETIDKEDDAIVYTLHTCDLCQKKYHDCCTKDMGAFPTNSNMLGPSFCGKSCKELFEHLKKYLGIKHELDAGFTWSLIHRTDEDSDAASKGITQSKLAVALTVMDECFLPVVDRRSGVNLIHNVLYNSGSNFSRLNYSGFYTAILERGDEIISAASIRFHGTKLAEMPFIGTRHIYRHQGMCRRLFSAIELTLCSLKVEKLVIPAISELVHTWTKVFGFTHLEESLRQETRSLNMLVFPGIDMLQKLLVEQGRLEGAEKIENGDEDFIKPNTANRLDVDASDLQDPHGSEDASSDPANEMNNECSDASQELNDQGMVGRTVCSKSHSEERLSDSISDNCVSPSSTSHGVIEKKNEIGKTCPVNDKLCLSKCQLVSSNDISTTTLPIDAPDCPGIPVLGQETACSDPDSAKNMVELVSDRKCHALNDNALSSEEVDTNDTRDEDHETGPSVNLSQENISKENKENVDISGSVCNHAGDCSLEVRSELNSEIA